MGRVIVTDGIYDAFIGNIVEKSRRSTWALLRSFRVHGSGDLREPPHALPPVFPKHGRSGTRLSFPPSLCRAWEGVGVRPCIIGVDWERGSPVLGGEPPGPTLLVYRVRDWREAIALHNQVEARISTSLFTDRDNATLDEFRERLRTGALNINRGTIAASLRLPSIGLGTSSNGLGGGLACRAPTHPRSHHRGACLASMPKLPGVVWESDGRPSDQRRSTTIRRSDLSSYLERP